MKTAEQIGRDLAYPLTEHHGDGSYFTDHAGMTMRQHYKAAAVQGYLAAFSGSDVRMPSPMGAAEYCAAIADAMLAEDAEHEASLRRRRHQAEGGEMTPEQIALAVEAQARAYAALKHVGSNEQAAVLLSPEALEALLKANEWQPMETAPRDGREILAVSKTGNPFIVMCRNGKNEWYMTESDCYRDPIAWMPLPQPPSATAGKEADHE